ncbi:MAG: hypothetical protein FWF01_00750 [Alphaproteobacteria bacterium]|nr:hypothetical protein [Alphaproteobacteria bacterium]
MTIKEFLEIIAAFLTIIISITVLWGMMRAHRKGFFKAVHNITQYYEKLLDNEKD